MSEPRILVSSQARYCPNNITNNQQRKNKQSMPKQYETNSLGYKLKFNGPSTVEEYDQAAGRVGACLEDAIDNTIYRSTLPEWQGSFAKKLTEITGTQRG